MTTSLSDDVAASAGPGGWARSSAIQLVAALLSVFAAARLAQFVPLWVGLVVLLGALLMIRPRLLLLALVLLIAGRAGQELADLAPARTRPIDSEIVRLVDDPRPSGASWRVQADIEGERVVLAARSVSAVDLRRGSAGDRFQISGTLRGSSPRSAWAISRHIVGQVTIETADVVEHAGGVMGAANGLRSIQGRGVRSLARDRRVLFTGLVFGDDRGQDVIVQDNFRAAGLGHLLAVSGQNVVFVLLLAAPVISRVRSAPVRVGLALGLLVGFGFMTRFEPSVTRAIVMAGLALIAHAVGRPADAATVLPPAVAGLLLYDPLLAWSLGFQLSVAATAGLIIATPRIGDALPGPSWFRLTAAATIGAQLFVSPLLLATFGQVSLIAVPANLLATPAAAGVMMWGLVAGTIAGLAPEVVAVALHLPTRLMLWWIDGVASISARIPIGNVGIPHVVVIATCGAAMLALPQRVGGSLRAGRRLAAVTLVMALVLPVLAPKGLGPGTHTLRSGAVVARSAQGHDVLIVDGSLRSAALIESIRTARLGRIDLVISTDGSRSAGGLVRLLTDRFEVSAIWAPPGHEIPGARAMERFAGVVGTLQIEPGPDDDVAVVQLPSRGAAVIR